MARRYEIITVKTHTVTVHEAFEKCEILTALYINSQKVKVFALNIVIDYTLHIIDGFQHIKTVLINFVHNEGRFDVMLLI